MQEGVLRGVVVAGLLGCTFNPIAAGSADTDSDTEEADAASDDNPVTSQTGPSTSNSSDATMSGSGSTSGPGTDSGDPTGDPDTGDPTGDTEDPPLTPGCPSPLPENWILCEDFEDIENPNTHFTVFATNMIDDLQTFRIDTIQAYSGDSSLTVLHQPGMSWMGEAAIRFGVGPGIADYAPEETFDEVYVRLQIYLDDGWSQGGHGELLQVNSVQDGFVHTMSASVDGPGAGEVLRARARTCVDAGGSVLCSGSGDGGTLSNNQIATLDGETHYFTEPYSGEWHCLVARIALSDPGQSNGRVRFWLDDNDEADLNDIDFRGDYIGNSLNIVSLTAFWGGATEPTQRFMDDLVVSRTALDCHSN